MSAFKLKSIQIRNFATIREANVEFPESGLVLVRGKTNAEAGTNIESVGAGKTAFGEAIVKPLLGVLTRSTNISDYVHDEVNEDLYVKIYGDLNGQEIIVEQGYKCPELSETGEGLRFSVGGAPPIERNRIANTRLELAKTLGVDSTLASWTVFFDGEQMNFNKLSQTAAVDLLMLALNQAPWDAYHEKARDHAKTFKSDLSRVESQLTDSAADVKRTERAIDQAKATHETRKTEYDEELDHYDGKADRLKTKIDDSKARIRANDKRTGEIRKELKKVESEHAAENKKLELKKLDLGNKKARAARFETSRGDKIDAAERTIRKCDRELKAAKDKPDDCPTCGQKWHQATADTTEIDERRERAEAVSDRYADLMAEAQTDKRRYSKAIRDTEDALSDLGTRDGVLALSDEAEALERDSDKSERAKKNAQEDLDDLKKPSDSKVVAAKTLYDREVQELKRLEGKVQELNTEKVDTQESLRVIEYWVRAYSPAGIPNMVLRRAVAPLNSASQRLCAALTGGAMNVQYATTASLKSGADKPKLKITVDNSIGAKNIKLSSKGEAGISKLIVPETLAEVGQVARRIGFRWYDEVANHQDPAIRRNLYAHMQNVAEQLGILVFVVDHHPEIASFSDHVLLVEKQRGKTSVVRWE